MKTFVLDTNVLLHNSTALFSFGDNRVVIPITVIEELDKFKRNADEKGRHARAAVGCPAGDYTQVARTAAAAADESAAT